MAREMKTDGRTGPEQAAQVLSDDNGASRVADERSIEQLASSAGPPVTFAWPKWDHKIIANIRRILNSAARQTGLPFSVADERLHYFAWSDNAHFCHSFAHVRCPGLKEKCAQCEKLLLERMSTDGSPHAVYHCELLGVDDLFVPVRHRGRLVLVINCGAAVMDSTRLPEICDRLTACGCQVPRPQLEAAVRQRLPIVKPSQIKDTLELIQGVAALLEELIAMRWERAKLKYATHVDVPIRRLIRDFGRTRGNPLKTMSEIAGLLAEAVGADACCVWKKDMDRDRLFPLTTSGFGEADVLTLSPLDMEGSLAGRVIRGKPEIVGDLADCADQAALSVKESLLDMGYKALLCVPVRFDDEIPAAVTVYRRQAGSFHDDDAELLQELASYIWAAISTATFARHSVAQAEITHLLNVDHDVEQLYDSIASKVRDWIGARACSIFFRRGQSEFFDLRGTTGVKGSRTDAAYRMGSGLTGTVAQTGRSLRIYDCRDTSELRVLGNNLHWREEVVDAVEDELAKDAVRSFLAVPITVAGEVCGVIRVQAASLHRSVFSAEDEVLLSAIAFELGEAWKRFRLGDQVARVYEDTKAVLQDVQAVHQSVAQSMAPAQNRPTEIVRLAFNLISNRYPTWRWINLRVPDERQQYLETYYLTGPQAGQGAALRFPLRSGDSLSADSYLTKQSIYVPDITPEPRYKNPFDALGQKQAH